MIARAHHPVLVALLFLAVVLVLAPRAEAFVYWANVDGTIGRANLDGTGVDRRFITGAGAQVWGLAVDPAHVYWSNDSWSPQYGELGRIGRADLDGTSVDQSFIEGAQRPNGIAVDAAHVYWANSPYSIGRADLDGTSVDQNLINGVISPEDVAVDATHLYWADWSDDRPGTIGRANLDGTGANSSFIAPRIHDGPAALAVDAGHVYWADFGGGRIGRASLNGTRVDSGFIRSAGQPCELAVDANHVYWSDYGIGRAKVNGTGIERSFIPGKRISQGESQVCGVAVDALRSFSFGKVRKNKRRGTAKLATNVPARGELELTKTERVRGANERADAKGRVKLPVRSRGPAKDALKRKGQTNVRIEVTYTPRGAHPNIVASTLTKNLKLIKHR